MSYQVKAVLSTLLVLGLFGVIGHVAVQRAYEHSPSTFKQSVTEYTKEARAAAKRLDMAPDAKWANAESEKITNMYAHIAITDSYFKETGHPASELDSKLKRIVGAVSYSARMIELGERSKLDEGKVMALQNCNAKSREIIKVADEIDLIMKGEK